MVAGLEILPDARARRFANIFRNAPESVLRSCVFAWHPRMGSYATLGPKYGYQRLAGTFSSDAAGKRVYDRWAGQLRTFPQNVMPITGAQEPARTNLFTYSSDLTTGNWIPQGHGALNAGIIAPDGSSAAFDFVENTAGTFHRFFHPISSQLTGSSKHAFSIYAKYAGRQYLQLVLYDGTSNHVTLFDIQNGTLGNTLKATGKIESVGNGWYLCVMITNAVAASPSGENCQICMSDADTVAVPPTYLGTSQSVYLWEPLIEVGGYETSRISTGATQLTRSADAFRFTNSGLLNGLAGEGSLLLAFKAPYASTVPTTAPWLAALNGDSGADLAGFFTKDSDDKLYAQLVLGGIDAGAVALSTYSANTWYAAAMAWNASDLRAAINGTGGTPYGATDVPSVLSGLEIGAVGSASARQGADYALVACFDRALQQAELNALTYNPERYVGQAA